MKKDRNKIFEFLTLICMVIGIVIGTGEFIKNDNEKGSGHVLDATQNGWMAILLWAIIGIACVFMMLCFIEVASSTFKKGNGTTSSWAKIFINRKIASFISLFWIFFYVPIFYSVLSLMIIKYSLVSFDLTPDSGSLKYTMIYIFGSLGFLLFFAFLNTYFRTAGKYFQIIGTFLKLIPFILILLIGFIFPAHPNAFTKDDYQTWNATNFFSATGPILFSFDGFIFAANLQKETKNKDLIFKALLGGILIIVVVYILEAIALFSGTDSGAVSDLFANVFHTKNVDLVLNLMIVMAIIIGLNGNSLVGANYIVTDSNMNLICTFNKNISQKHSGLFQLCIGLIWFSLLTFLGLFVNNGMHGGVYDPGYYSDIFSNIIVIFAFIVYITILISAIINRFTKKVEVIKVKNMIFYGIVSITILVICISYSLVITIMNFDITTFLLFGTLVTHFILFLLNEVLLKKYPPEKHEENEYENEFIAI